MFKATWSHLHTMVPRYVWLGMIIVAFFAGIGSGHLLFSAPVSVVETQTHVAEHMESHISPWAGEQTREIKSLSARELDGLKHGHGVGMATMAELNSYPGPRHALDLAEPLNLTTEQRIKIERLYEDVMEQSIPLSRQLIEVEREMNEKFADRTISSENLSELVQKSGEIHWQLRNAHLQAHLKTVDILNQEQISRYNQLRGYT